MIKDRKNALFTSLLGGADKYIIYYPVPVGRHGGASILLVQVNQGVVCPPPESMGNVFPVNISSPAILVPICNRLLLSSLLYSPFFVHLQNYDEGRSKVLVVRELNYPAEFAFS